MGVEKRIRELIEEKIADRPDLFIVAIKMVNNAKVIILLDGDQGVGIHDCAMVSRHVGFHLEEENLIDQAYNLEVSSPGLDTPLLLDRQFKKNIGRLLIIKLNDGKKVEGELIDHDDANMVILEMVKEKGKKAKQVERTIHRNEISEVKVGVSFK